MIGGQWFIVSGQEDSMTEPTFSSFQGHCYYHGHVQGYSGSTVSLSTCSGLR